LNEATRMHQPRFHECISSMETFVPPAVVRSSRLLLSAYRRSLPPWRRAVGSRLPPRVSCLSAGSEREARPKPHSFHTDGHQHFATFMYVLRQKRCVNAQGVLSPGNPWRWIVLWLADGSPQGRELRWDGGRSLSPSKGCAGAD
jgi:hypothetical protein